MRPVAEPPTDPAAASRYDDLVRISTELFSEHGYDRTSVRMIAERMGIQSGSLYSHVPTKEHLLYEIVMSVARDMWDRSQSALAAGTTPVERLRELCRAHFATFATQRPALRVYFVEWRKLSPARLAEVKEFRRRYEALFASLISEAVAAGAFAPGIRTHAAVNTILGSLNGAHEWYDPEGSMAPDRLADEIVDVILRGLLTRADDRESVRAP